jgi:hypothetical protein
MNKLVAVHPKQPATQKPWPTQGEINALANRLDSIVRFGKRFDSITKHNVREKLGELQRHIDDFERGGGKRTMIEYAQGQNSLEPEPDEWRDEEWRVQRSAVSKMLAFLVGSFPTSNLPDARVFTIVMLDDVMALEPSFAELECACRKLRQSQKFMPSISEIVAEVKDQKKAWDRRFSALDCIEDSYNNAIALRDAELKRIEEEATRKPKVGFAVGDVVSHSKFGAGIILEVDDNKCRVSFEEHGEKSVVASFLWMRTTGDD